MDKMTIINRIEKTLGNPSPNSREEGYQRVLKDLMKRESVSNILSEADKKTTDESPEINKQMRRRDPESCPYAGEMDGIPQDKDVKLMANDIVDAGIIGQDEIGDFSDEEISMLHEIMHKTLSELAASGAFSDAQDKAEEIKQKNASMVEKEGQLVEGVNDMISMHADILEEMVDMGYSPDEIMDIIVNQLSEILSQESQEQPEEEQMEETGMEYDQPDMDEMMQEEF